MITLVARFILETLPPDLNLWLDLEFLVMAQYYFVQSNLSPIIIFLITNYHIIAFTDSKVAEKTRSKEKYVESLLHELVAWAPGYDSTLVVWIDFVVRSVSHLDNTNSKESENPFLEVS